MALQGQIKNLKQLQILWVILGLSCGLVVAGLRRACRTWARQSGEMGERAEVGSLHPFTRGTSAFDQCGRTKGGN